MDRYHIKALLACSLISYSTISYSDDSEIFFSKDLSATKPNIIFLLDISGSMTSTLGTNRNRLDVLKESMESILTSDDTKDVRIGIMSFATSFYQNHQVVDLDSIDTSKDVVTKTTSSNPGYTILTQPVINGLDNGYQTSSTTAKAVLALRNSFNGAATQYYSTANSTTIGYRFNNILVKNATTAGISSTTAIKKAQLKFYRSTTTAINFSIWTDPEINAAQFRPFTNYFRSRVDLSGSATTCTTTSGTGSQYVTCDVTNLVRNKIGQSDWKDGNAIAFYLRPSATTNMYFSTSTTAAYRPSLEIEVDTSLAANNSKTYRDELLYTSFGLFTTGSTQIVESILNVAKYVSNVTKSYSTSTQGPYHVTTYGTSPLQEGCQLTHLVLMTDGEANYTGHVNTGYYMTGKASSCPIYTDSEGTTIADHYATSYERCGRALTSWMARNTQSDFEGGNYIRTHAIGFTLSSTSNAQKFINDLAIYGMGKPYNASNASELTEAFKDIVSGALVVDSPSTSGQVTMSPQSTYKQRNEVYYALYKSENYDYWPGNMKGFQIKYIETTYSDGSTGQRAVLQDKNGNSALGADGIIKNTASSRWSTSDGGNVEQGGVVALLKTPNLRNVFTINGTTTEELRASSSLTNTDLALSGDNQDNVRKGLLNFIRGYKYAVGGSTDENSKKIGDSAKSGVSLATYGCSSGKNILECDFSNLSQVALLAGNDGFIRGFDSVTGEALYEYMPKEMLPIIKHLQARKTLSINEVRNYGMDGDITIFHDDKNSDGYIDAGEDAFAYVVSGRGGPYLFAINITNKTSPKLAWMIDDKTTGFTKLGDTWSKPVVGKINIGGTITPVLIFGGGYDRSQDDNTARHADTVGNALYVVNARTGNLIWSTSSNMSYSIPSSVAVVTENLDTASDPDDPDNENDTFITDIFFGDMGGQLWRFQVNNGNPVSSLIVAGGGNGGIVANFADNSLVNSRRFYYPPVVTKFKSKEYEDTLSVSIGSGYRAHPLSTDIEDRIYSLRLPKQADLTSTKVFTESDLAVTSLDGQTIGDSDNLKNGFYIRLGAAPNSAGEKVVSAAYADFERIVFNTYTPTKTVTKNCVPGSGTQRTYNYSIVTGESLLTTAYEQTSVSTLPPDVTAYCNGKFCTIVSGPGYLSEENTLSEGKNGIRPWNPPVDDEGGAWDKIGWTDYFDPSFN